MRLTHRRCRAEAHHADMLVDDLTGLTDHLTDTANRLTGRNEDLQETATDIEADLQAAEFTLAEIRAAYTVSGYVDEASVPEDLRALVREALRAHQAGTEAVEIRRELAHANTQIHMLKDLLSQQTEDLARTLEDAHQAGALVRVFVSLARTVNTDLLHRAAREADVPSLGRLCWTGSDDWGLKSCPGCGPVYSLVMVRHFDSGRGRLLCSCSRSWPAGEAAMRRAARIGTDPATVSTNVPLRTLPSSELAAADLVLPTVDEHRASTAPAAVSA